MYDWDHVTRYGNLQQFSVEKRNIRGGKPDIVVVVAAVAAAAAAAVLLKANPHKGQRGNAVRP